MANKVEIRKTKYQSGFSLIEMLVATVLVLFVSATGYKILTSQGKAQKDSVSNQKQNLVVLTALDHFKRDITLVDPNWIKFGVASIYPHQGLGFGNNFYTDAMNRSEGLNDAVSFIRRDVENSQLNTTVYPITFTPGGVDAKPVFDAWIRLTEPTTQAQAGDWVLIYEAGKYALGVVTDVQTTPFTGIKIRRPDSTEIQTTHTNVWGRSSGFVTKAGVAPASFDWTGTNTASTDDNGIAFVKNAKVQVVIPVTYEIDWATSDGQPHGNGNSYILDDDGNQKKMVVRTAFNGHNGKTREYVADADQMGITYDALKSTYGGVSGLTGYEEGQIVRDIGRQTSSEMQFVNLSVTPNNTEGFISTSRIVSARMFLGKDIDQQDQENKKFNQIKVAIDPNIQNDRYQDTANVESFLTANLQIPVKMTTNSTFNDQSGKPLYLVNSNGNEVLVPVSSFEVKSDGTMGTQSSGAIYLYDTEGCAINPGTACKPSNNSKIKFNVAGDDGTFFPNTIAQVKLADGTRRIIIGGVAMNRTSASSETAQVTRTPGIGVITLGPTETLKDRLQSPVTGSSCNIAGCEWHAIDNTSLPGLVDTANISVDKSNPNVMYVATMTKQSGANSQSKIFKGTWTGSDYTYQEVDSVIGTENSKVVTAVSDRTLTFKGVGSANYIAVCVSKKMSASCGGECLVKPQPLNSSTRIGLISHSTTPPLSEDLADGEDAFGEIQLIPVTNTETAPTVRLTEHNYRCSSLNVDNKNNLIVGGRLTAQHIPWANMQKAIAGDPMDNFMYLDEVISQGATYTAYADYFQVEPHSYPSNASPQNIGWLTGLSTVQFLDGSFGMVATNKFRLAANYGDNAGNDDDKDFSNAGIFKGEFGGMDARVIATIQTDAVNYNASQVSTVYSAAVSKVPDIYIPGKFYKRPGHSRTTPTPLPAMSPSMSEASWFKLYQDLLTPHQEGSLDTGMPVFGNGMQQATNCLNTKPKTCS